MDGNKLIDASILIAAYVEGNNLAEKLLRDASQLYILDLTKIEVGNVLTRANVHALDALKILQELKYKPFTTLYSRSEDYENAFKLAITIGATTYDALYHSIALTSNLNFITLDQRYYHKAKVLGNISLLGE